MPDKPFFMYFAPGATPRPASRAEGVDRQVQGQVRPGLGQAARRDLRAAEEAGRDPRGCRADQAARRNPRLGRRCRRTLQADPRPRDGGLCRRSSSTPTITSAGWSTRWRISEILDDTLIYYIIGDNGASAEGTPNGCFNEMAVLNGMGTLETPEFLHEQDRRLRRARTPTTTTRSAGRTRWTRPTSGPSRWRRTWAAPATARSCTGRTASRRRARSASQFRHVIDIAPTILEAAGLPHPTVVNSMQQAPIEGVSMLYAFNDAKAAERHETQYFEMFCNRGIYHKGWTAVTRHGVPWVGAYKRGLRRRRLGAVRHQHRLDPVEGPRQGESEEAAPSCSGSS